jgi:hypothetical protein
MSINAAQIKMIKTAQRALGIDDDDYRRILQTLAGVESCTKLDNRSFERVMRHFEECGFRRFSGPAGDRFRMRKFHAGLFASPEERHKIADLAEKAGVAVPGFVLRMTRGRIDDINKITPREAYNVIEGLKKIIERAEEKARLDKSRGVEGSPCAPRQGSTTGTDAGDSQDGWRVYGSPTTSGVCEVEDPFSAPDA